MLYYKHLVDEALADFFEEYGKDFTRAVSGKYVFSGRMSRKTMMAFFETAILDGIKRRKIQQTFENPSRLCVIGGCVPADNILLDSQYGKLPRKLIDFIRKNPDVRYILREKDIDIDINVINEIFDDIFIRFFSGKICMADVFFIRHSRLDCYLMFKVLKNLYGASNCENLSRSNDARKDKCIVALNDLVKTYSANMRETLKRTDFLKITESIAEFVFARK